METNWKWLENAGMVYIRRGGGEVRVKLKKKPAWVVSGHNQERNEPN